MNKKATNYHLLSSISAFAVHAEEATNTLSAQEIDEHLESQGVDLIKLEANTLRRLKKLRSQMTSLERPVPRRKELHRRDMELLVAGKIEHASSIPSPEVVEAPEVQAGTD